MNDGRDYRYQRDWTVGTQMFHVRCDEWETFKEAVDNMNTMIKTKAFPDDEGNIATPQEQVISEAPKCGVHGTPMTLKPAGTSKMGRPYPAFWSCGQKNADGTYCKFKPS